MFLLYIISIFQATAYYLLFSYTGYIDSLAILIEQYVYSESVEAVSHFKERAICHYPLTSSATTP